jgi:hypothetical protein
MHCLQQAVAHTRNTDFSRNHERLFWLWQGYLATTTAAR